MYNHAWYVSGSKIKTEKTKNRENSTSTIVLYVKSAIPFRAFRFKSIYTRCSFDTFSKIPLCTCVRWNRQIKSFRINAAHTANVTIRKTKTHIYHTVFHISQRANISEMLWIKRKPSTFRSDELVFRCLDPRECFDFGSTGNTFYCLIPSTKIPRLGFVYNSERSRRTSEIIHFQLIDHSQVYNCSLRSF